MRTLGRLAAFVLGLAAVFGVALAAGSLWGPTIANPAAHDDGQAAQTAGHGSEDARTTVERPPGGLMRSQGGYSLDLTPASAEAGEDVPLSFTVHGPDGSPVTAYDVAHGRRLHLIVVRRDLTGYQHVHPALDPGSGTWSTDVDLQPGTWRVFADFRATGGPALTLGADLTVPGEVPVPDGVSPERTTAVLDGYTVDLAGRLVGGSDVDLSLKVSRAGRPVTDLEPYLGAYGHLVALRDGDLAYLHVHPHDSDAAGPGLGFSVEVPSEGRYRLFLDFRHRGQVRTATFDVTAARP